MRLLAIALVIVGGCRNESPESAVHGFIDATNGQRRAEAYELLGPRTKERLMADSRRAAALSPSLSGPLEPSQMLAVGWTSPERRPKEVRQVAMEGERAVVEVIAENGAVERVECVRDRGKWRIELP